VIPNFEFEIASARMYSPTNFVVSSEIGGMSTRGQHRRSATIDIHRLKPLHRNQRRHDERGNSSLFPLPSGIGGSLAQTL
jgi:hypothetical protein